MLAQMRAMGAAAREAARALALMGGREKAMGLDAAAAALLAREPDIVAANGRDLAAASANGAPAAMIDRLRFDADRLAETAEAVRSIAAQPDPVGRELAAWTRPSGLRIRRVSTPLGVIGVIYESRPNVTADAAALCVKSGNAVILRGGSDSFHTARAIHAAMAAGLREAGAPEAAIQMVDVTDRAAVGAMLEHMSDQIDVIVPRGGRSLVERVRRTARVPVFAHLDGICHVYVDKSADLEKALAVTVNAKMRRTAICGAAECLLVDRAAAKTHLAPLLSSLIEAGCAVRGDAAAVAADPRVRPASPEDYGREFLDAVIAVKLVDGVPGAVAHIDAHSSGHTEAMLGEDDAAWAEFAARVDSAIVMRNASTQFADGGEFGMGAEIGIATGRMHARGPVGAEQLTSFKYVVVGDGSVRP
ncbi:MAG: glutamate-5-semialdehyde dehydrogenase [Pseudomonadota bacterium]